MDYRGAARRICPNFGALSRRRNMVDRRRMISLSITDLEQHFRSCQRAAPRHRFEALQKTPEYGASPAVRPSPKVLKMRHGDQLAPDKTAFFDFLWKISMFASMLWS